MSVNISIRNEIERDYGIVEHLTRDAFWDIYKPGSNEHLLAHNLRQCKAFLPELDFVAVHDDYIVGNIMYSAAQVTDDNGCAHPVLTFGPLSVLPAFQKQGVGTALVRHTLAIARKIGYPAVVIFGKPEYYHRFGFVNAEKFQITTKEGTTFDSFMVLELHEGALKGITGRFNEDAVFDIAPSELEVFDKYFPYREKHVT